VTNVEGVFTRFENAIETIIRGEDGVEAESAKQILERLQMARVGGFILTIELLDPRGRSQIIHSEATSRELGDDEKEVLESGPEIPVFDLN
jgi:C4-type Zn-finger protein